MTEAELEKRIADLEAELDAEDTTSVSPEILAKAKSMLQFSVMDIQTALGVLGVVPSEEQMIAIEEAVIASKVSAMSDKAARSTLAKWTVPTPA